MISRTKTDIWGLVDYDPVCGQAERLRDLVVDHYPSEIARMAAELYRRIRGETYDRLNRCEEQDQEESPEEIS